jgi:hypothetical protein
MSVEGLCQICESNEAVDRCERCSALVCDRHFDTTTGFCANCATEFGDDSRDRDSTDDSNPDVHGDYQY